MFYEFELEELAKYHADRLAKYSKMKVPKNILDHEQMQLEKYMNMLKCQEFIKTKDQQKARENDLQ